MRGSGRVRCLTVVWVVLSACIVSVVAHPGVASAGNQPGALLFPFTYPINGTVGYRLVPGVNSAHDGTDMFAYGGLGAPVYASYSGFVHVADTNASAAWNGTGVGYGRYVILRHGFGLETRYVHLNSLAVATNQRVATGQLIGYQGKSGGSNNSVHLHFEIFNTNTGYWVDVNSQMAAVPLSGPVTAQSPIGFSGWWGLKNDPTNGPAVKNLQFGLGGDIPVSGDWDGDGYDTPGIVRYNTSNGLLDWWLTNTKLTTAADGSLLPVASVSQYGIAGDTPVAGDWNVGADEFGMVRRSGGVLYWLLSGAPVWNFVWGLQNDVPVVGDWDCDGDDNPGVNRDTGAAQLQWHLDYQYATAAEQVFVWGERYPAVYTDHGLAGQWNSTSCARPIIARNGAYQWLGVTGFPGTLGMNITFAGDNDIALVSDWDNDSYDDFIALW